jgi:hypothetical protein
MVSLSNTVSPSVREAVLPSFPVPPGTVKIEEDREMQSFIGTSAVRLNKRTRRRIDTPPGIFRLEIPNDFTPVGSSDWQPPIVSLVKVHERSSPFVAEFPPLGAKIDRKGIHPTAKARGLSAIERVR